MRRARWSVVVACVLWPVAAVAQTPPTEAEPAPAPSVDLLADLTAEQRFMVLHGAVVAYERCMGEQFNEAQAMAINARIREIVGESFGAGRTLQMIYDGQQAMNQTLSSQGCSSDPVAAAVALFQTEMAPAMGAPASDGG